MRLGGRRTGTQGRTLEIGRIDLSALSVEAKIGPSTRPEAELPWHRGSLLGSRWARFLEVHVAFIGEMGVGKTTLGRRLAQHLQRRFLDSDQVLEDTAGVAGSLVAEAQSVSALHARELEVARTMMRTKTPSVIAVASSLVDSEEGRTLLRGCLVIWLVAPADVLTARLDLTSHRRPTTSAERHQLLERRTAYYAALADITIDTGSTDPMDLVLAISREFELRRSLLVGKSARRTEPHTNPSQEP